MRNLRSLRVRLLAVTLGLVAVGLLIAGVVTYTSLRSFLYDRIDRQLTTAVSPAANEVVIRQNAPDFGPRPGRGQRLRDLPRGTVIGVYDRGGDRLVNQLDPDPPLPVRVASGFFDGEIAGRGRYRFYAALPGEDADADGATDFFSSPENRLLIGIPTGDVSDTLGRLVIVELLVGLAVLGAIGGLGMWLVRLGLAPLSEIERTAGAIAAGDLSRRIDETDPDTEVGRLGGALNVMLGRIEESFAEREASERRLRQFVADASHELQTPLTSVRGYAELFRRGAAERPEDLANAMTRIEAESQRMGVLVDDLLMLARLDQGRPIAREPVDLVQVARDLVGDARVVDPDRLVDLVATDPVRITGDEPRLRQVVANLLSNARTHTPSGTRITVTVRRDNAHAVIEVADNGPGMTADHAARVFERFFRVDPSRARASGGSGLGLSIVAAIARAHGGSVDVATVPGEGATFRVTLPIHPIDAAEAPSQATGSSDVVPSRVVQDSTRHHDLLNERGR